MTIPAEQVSPFERRLSSQSESSATPEIQQHPHRKQDRSDGDLSDDGSLLPTRDVLARYRIHARTLERWLIDPELGFPQPIAIKRHRYFRLRDLQIFERESLKRQPA